MNLFAGHLHTLNRDGNRSEGPILCTIAWDGVSNTKLLLTSYKSSFVDLEVQEALRMYSQWACWLQDSGISRPKKELFQTQSVLFAGNQINVVAL